MVEPRKPSAPISFMISRSKRSCAVRFEHARHQLFLAIVARAVAHHAFFFAQRFFEEERIGPVKFRFGRNGAAPGNGGIGFHA